MSKMKRIGTVKSIIDRKNKPKHREELLKEDLAPMIEAIIDQMLNKRCKHYKITVKIEGK